MKSSCVFVPTTSLGVREASSDIASNVWTTWRSGAVGEVLVLCLPAVSIHSVANTPMDVLQDIPITMPHGALLSQCSSCASLECMSVCVCVCVSVSECECVCVSVCVCV